MPKKAVVMFKNLANFRGIKIWYTFFIMVVPGSGEWKMKLWFHLHSFLYYISETVFLFWIMQIIPKLGSIYQDYHLVS